MPFLLLLLLTLVCLIDPWPEPMVRLGGGSFELAVAGSVLLTLLTLTFQMIAAASVSRWTASRLLLFPEDREQIVRRHTRLRQYLLLGLLASYSVTLWIWGWGWAVQSVLATGGPGQAAIIPGAELLTLVPFLAGLLISWACLYDADKALHDTAPAAGRHDFFVSRRDYVGFQIRHNLALLLVPLFLLILEKGLSRYWPGIHQHWVYQIGAFIVIASVFVGLPWILRLVLALHPLPDGPLRERLAATSQRLRFRCSDILCWDTRGVAANAMVAGLAPYPRYVILTDKLVAELTPDEVEAVFGHEVGHVRHRHMLYYVVFLVLSLGALAGAWELAASAMQTASAFSPIAAVPAQVDRAVAAGGLRVVPFIALLGTYIFVVFGFLSRRCEREADVFGCRTVSCGSANCIGHYADEQMGPRGEALCSTGIRTFISALEKVAYLNGISRDRPGWLQSWQHSTIARRVHFLQQLLVEPKLESKFRRHVRFVKWMLLLGLVAAALAIWLLVPGLALLRGFFMWSPI
jgi:STE24 endopeptidase